MTTYQQRVIDVLNGHEMFFESQDNVIKIGNNGNYTTQMNIYIIFRENSHVATIASSPIATFSETNYVNGLTVCNDLNGKYQHVKFCLDADRDLMASADAIVDDRTAGGVCFELMMELSTIIDEAYPEIQDALNG